MLNVVEERDQAFDCLSSNQFIGILEVLNEERKEGWIEGFQGVSRVIKYEWQ